MSGGHWNYQQEHMRTFAEELQEERDPVLKAIGDHLVKVSKVLHDFDWMISCDTSKDGWEDAQKRGLALLPSREVVDMARKDLESAIKTAAMAIGSLK